MHHNPFRNCPRLEELPAPPSVRSGWPWTREFPPLPAHMFDGSAWPRISIVTPSLNQGLYIEETIRSVLLQGYPNLEYIIMDGGSKDATLDILRRYEKWLSYWVSEPDQGQADAINKGLFQSRGEILAWLNSDDFYEPCSLSEIAKAFHQYPKSVLIYGDCVNIHASGETISVSHSRPFDRTRLIKCWPNFIPQPSTFFRRSTFESIAGLNTSLHYVMDYDLWIRLTQCGSAVYLPQCLSRFRVHAGAKTGSGSASYWPEMRLVSRRHGSGFWSPMYIKHLRDRFYLLRQTIFATIPNRLWTWVSGKSGR